VNLKGAEVARYLAKPDPTRPGLLIWGQDGGRVALKRQEAVAALTGPGAEEEMRLTRLSGAELRKDAALLLDAVKAVGFFPGQRVVLVDDATDGCAPAAEAALRDWAPGDAVVVLTAGGLGKGSALRKLFEGHPRAVAAAIYDDPPGEEEVARWLAEGGLKEVPRDAMREVMLLARALEPGDLRQTIEKIALYKWQDSAPLTAEEVAALAPQTLEGEVDVLIDAVAEGRARDFGPLMRRIEAQGTTPVTLAIAALRHFRALHAAASDPGGAQAGIARLRPPVLWNRRDRMVRQAGDWGQRRLEDAVHLLIDTDLTLRSSSRAPAMAVVERALIRLAMMPRGGR